MPDTSFYLPFQPISKEEWNRLLGEQASRTYKLSERVEVPVFIEYSPSFVPESLAEKGQNNWRIVAKIEVRNTSLANEQALEALVGGADELLFVLRKPIDWSILLKGVELPMIHLSLQVSDIDLAERLMDDLVVYISSKVWDAANLEGSWIVNGKELGSFLNFGRKQLPKFSLLSLRQKVGDDQEVAFAKILQEADDLRKKHGIEVLETFRFELLSEKNLLKTIAGIRAFRLLWRHYLTQVKAPSVKSNLSLQVADNQWTDDENKNRILATTQAMSAVIGGCDHLIIPAVQSGSFDSFSERISRNISHIMKMESYMDRVEDPAAGSRLIEALTAAIAKSAWDVFVK